MIDDVSTSFVDEQEVVVRSDKEAAVLAAHATSIQNITRGDNAESLDKAYLGNKTMFASTPDTGDVEKSIANELSNYYNDVLSSMVEESLDRGQVEAGEVLKDAVDIQVENTALLNEPAALEHANILAVEGRVDRVRAERMYHERTIAGLVEDLPIMSTVTNYAEFLLPDHALDTKAFTDKYMPESSLNPYDDLRSIANYFMAAPIEERLILWEQFTTDAIEATRDFGTKNEHKAALLLATIIDPERSLITSVDEAFSAFDWATLGTSALMTVAKIAKRANSVKRLKDVGDISTAARANAAAASDDVAAATLNQEKDIAAANMLPFNYEHILPEAADGLTLETNKLLDAVKVKRQAVADQLKEVVAHEGFLKESALTVPEQGARKEAAVQEIEAIYNNTGRHVESAEIINSSEKGFTIRVKSEGIEEDVLIEYRLNDVEGFDVLEAGSIQTKLWSPQVWMDKILNDSVEVATRMNFAEQAVLGELKAAVDIANKGVGLKSRKSIDSILLAGDEFDAGTGKLFTIRELRAGVATPEGIVKLDSANDIASYYAHREVFDSLWTIKNNQVRRQLELGGFQEVDLAEALSATARLAVAKPYESAASLPQDLRTVGTKLWDSRKEGRVVDASRTNFSKLYDDDFTVVKTNDAFEVEGAHYNYAIVTKESIKELPTAVLNRKNGYVPKIYDDGYYFVKSSVPSKLNGRSVPAGNIVTHRIFDNKLDADAWAADENLKKDGTHYETKHDRQMGRLENEEEIVSEMGGLYTGARATHQLKFGLNGDTPVRVSATEAMARNVQNVANTLPINEWRMGMIRRWTNAAGDLIDDPRKGLDAVITAEAGKSKTALEASRTWIKDQLRLPTEDERKWAATMRDAAEWMEGKPLINGGVRKAVLDLGNKDPFGAMRAASFHSLLGWFNPAQLFVQAQGFAVALSLDPLKAPRRMQEFGALRAAYFVRNNKEAVAKTAKAMGLDPKFLQETVEQLRKTGLFESIKSNADYAAAQQFHNVGMAAVSKAANSSLVFYTEGERFTRGYAFLTAKARWLDDQKKLGKSTKIGDDELKEILSRTVTKMMNLNRANRAHWQKGILSIPTQYMQITTKFMEAMMPNILPGATGKFTPAQKSQIMLGQMALYGTAGVPLGSWLTAETLNMMGKKPGDLSEVELASITDGAWGALGQIMFDERFDVGARGALMSGAEQLFDRVFIQEAPFPEIAFGAFGEVPSRIYKGWGAVGPMLLNAHDIEWTHEERMKVLDEALSVVSTWRNAHTAELWIKNESIMDSKGRLISAIDPDKNRAAIWAKRLGISPRMLSDHYTRKNYNKGIQENEREVADSYRKLLRRYTKEMIPTPEEQKNFKILKSFIFSTTDPNRARKLQQRVHKEISDPKDQRSQEIRRAILNWIDTKEVSSNNAQVIFTEGLSGEQE